MDDSSRTGMNALAVDRRRFLRLGVVGGAAGLLALPAGTSWAKSHNRSEAFVSSCMDYRLVHATERYMAGRGLEKKYYQAMLAGASLAANPPTRPMPPPPDVKAWNTAFWDHLATAIALSGDRPAGPLRRVFVIDHRDCGAYDILLPGCCRDSAGNLDPVKETAAHAAQLRTLRAEIDRRYPNPKMQVELLLMGLDGTVETIT